MTSPISGFTSATPIETPEYWSLQITGTEQGAAIGLALEQAVENGLIHVGETTINAHGWKVQVNEDTATTGDWIVIGTDSAGQLISLALYNGPDGTYSNRSYTQDFVVPAITWAATTTAPTATATSGGGATITFPAPTSPGTFAYAVTQADTTKNATGPATLSGSPVVNNGQVTLTVTDLAVGGPRGGDSYTFTVTASNGQNAVTSIASNSITATA